MTGQWVVPIMKDGEPIGIATFLERGSIESGFISADCVLAPAISEGEVDEVMSLNMFPARAHKAIADAIFRVPVEAQNDDTG